MERDRVTERRGEEQERERGGQEREHGDALCTDTLSAQHNTSRGKFVRLKSVRQQEKEESSTLLSCQE